MRKILVVLGFVLMGGAAAAQKVDSIYFNLYTDSLKKVFSTTSAWMGNYPMAPGFPWTPRKSAFFPMVAISKAMTSLLTARIPAKP